MKKSTLVFTLILSVLILITGCTTAVVVQPTPPLTNNPTAVPGANGEFNLPAINIQTNAPGPNPLTAKPDTHGIVAGVLLGLWHGFIAPVTMVISFFNPNIAMYEVHNDGSQYNLGFFFGLSIFILAIGAFLTARR